MSEHRLHRIMNPSSIAFIGASNNIQTMGTAHLNTLLSSGYPSPIWPVHSKEQTVLGLPAYKDISSLPEPADLLVMLVNRDRLPSMLEEAGRRGIRRAVIITGGLAESTDYGPALQEDIQKITARFGISVIGPNCIGVVNPYADMNVTYFPYTARPGDIGLLSHSGTYLCHMYAYLHRRGMGLAQGMSLGNELNLDMADGIEYFENVDQVKVIALYVESIRRPQEFIRIARRVSRKKPIVAMSVGASDAGSRAASSHTAALTGAKGVLQGALDQAGIIRASGMQELYDFTGVLATQPPLKGKRIAVLTNSGGPGASTAEALERIGLECPELSAATQDRIRQMLPQTASAKNPVDFTYSLNMDAFYVDTPKILMEDPDIDGLIMYGLFGIQFWEDIAKSSKGRVVLPELEPMKQMMDYFLDSLARLSATYKKPLLVVNFEGLTDDATARLRELRVPVLPSPERAAACMNALLCCNTLRNRPQ